jgi:predicted phage terminase large subunit-like protein
VPEVATFRREWFRYYRPSADDAFALDGSTFRRRIGLPAGDDVRLGGEYQDLGRLRRPRLLGGHEERAAALFRPAAVADGGPDIVPALQRMYKQWRPATVGIESVAFEPSIVQQARRVGLPKRELRPDKDKVSRAYTAAARMEGGGVFFRRERPTSESLEAALLKFPAGRHHDMVDMPSYVIAEVIQQRRLPFDVEDGSDIVPRDYWLRP